MAAPFSPGECALCILRKSDERGDREYAKTHVVCHWLCCSLWHRSLFGSGKLAAAFGIGGTLRLGRYVVPDAVEE